MKIKKVFLFYPPGPQYQRGEDRSQGNVENSTATSMRAPNDMGYVSAQLDQKNIENIFTDYASEHKNSDDLFKDFLDFSPDVVITSTTTSTIKDDLKIIEQMKLKKNCIFIMKGSIFYKAPSFLIDSLDLKDVDFLIGGEIEFAAANIIDKINNNQKDFNTIPGIFVKEGNEWQESKFDNWNKEIDDLPFPNRSKVNNELYFRPDTGEPQATIATSRGCPSACVYCLTPTISGKKTRLRSPKSIIEELSMKHKEIHLVGYSGGAGIAMYLGSINNQSISSIRTVAGNINHNALTKLLKITNLRNSLNFYPIIKKTNKIPQIHYYGLEDKVVPNKLQISYKNQNADNNCINISPVKAAHVKGWETFWINNSNLLPKCN